MKCDYCGAELKGNYLAVDPNYFNGKLLEFEEEVFCDEECFLEALSDAGAIWDEGVNSDEI